MIGLTRMRITAVVVVLSVSAVVFGSNRFQADKPAGKFIQVDGRVSRFRSDPAVVQGSFYAVRCSGCSHLLEAVNLCLVRSDLNPQPRVQRTAVASYRKPRS